MITSFSSLRLEGEEIVKYRCVCRPRVEKFSISDEHGYMRKFDFSVLDQKYPFWSNLVQKITIVSLNSHLVLRLIQVCRIQ